MIFFLFSFGCIIVLHLMVSSIRLLFLNLDPNLAVRSSRYELRVHNSSKGRCSFSPLDASLFYSQVARPLTLVLPLSCPQIVTARIVTSRLHCFVGGPSLKKADVYYCCLGKKY